MICEICGKLYVPKQINLKYKSKYCSLRCLWEGQKGERNWNWKGGFTYDSVGYKQIIIKGKHTREHRIIMEEYLKRKLLPIEHLHHKNGIKDDNRVENLEIMSNSEHQKFHPRQRNEQGQYI